MTVVLPTFQSVRDSAPTAPDMVAETVGESESGGAFSSPAAGTCNDLQVQARIQVSFCAAARSQMA